MMDEKTIESLIAAHPGGGMPDDAAARILVGALRQNAQRGVRTRLVYAVAVVCVALGVAVGAAIPSGGGSVGAIAGDDQNSGEVVVSTDIFADSRGGRRTLDISRWTVVSNTNKNEVVR